MEIKILGACCANCKKLEENTRQAVKELAIEANITKVEDVRQIAKYGVMRIPALIIDEKVKSYGKVNTVEEIKNLIQNEK